MSMALGNFLTTAETAKALDLSICRVHQFVSKKRLTPAQKVGSLLFFDKETVEEFKKTPRKHGRPKKS
jgi:hypothetical protein